MSNAFYGDLSGWDTGPATQEKSLLFKSKKTPKNIKEKHNDFCLLPHTQEVTSLFSALCLRRSEC
jgi:hypothetical protein